MAAMKTDLSRAVALGLLLAATYTVWTATNAELTALFVLGVAAGIAMLTASFGFATAWRDLVTGRSTRLFRGQLFMIGCASLIMVP